MSCIGLLGGMSWESSIEYERTINELVRKRLGGVHSAELVIRSYDFARIERLQEDERWDDAGALLAADARRRQGAGAELRLSRHGLEVLVPDEPDRTTVHAVIYDETEAWCGRNPSARTSR